MVQIFLWFENFPGFLFFFLSQIMVKYLRQSIIVLVDIKFKLLKVVHDGDQ